MDLEGDGRVNDFNDYDIDTEMVKWLSHEDWADLEANLSTKRFRQLYRWTIQKRLALRVLFKAFLKKP